jgi:hypothetical protein
VGPVRVLDVMSFQFKAVMAAVAGRGKRLDRGGKVHLAAPDAAVDVAQDCVTQLHVADAIAEAAHRFGLISPACHHVTEVEHSADQCIPELLVQHF